MKHHHFQFRTLGSLVLVLIISSFQPPVDAAEPISIVDEIRQASKSYQEAIHRGDPTRIANSWTPKGTYVDLYDNTFQVRSIVEEEFSEQISPPAGERFENHTSTIRSITSEVAIEQGNTLPDNSNGTNAPRIGYIAIWVKLDNRWLLEYVKELVVSSPPRETDHLHALSWMVGEWESQMDGASAHLTVKWSEQRRFLIQRFSVRFSGQAEIKGEQRIAWDASSKAIRSWLFRSDGGFVEGVWRRKEDSWVVEKSGVMPNGDKTVATDLWVYEAPNTCWFKSLNVSVGDLKVDDVILKFTRVESP